MPVTLRNVSGLGDLEVDGLGLVEAGATFTVDDELGERLARQTEHFAQVTSKKAKATTTDPATAGTSEESA